MVVVKPYYISTGVAFIVPGWALARQLIHQAWFGLILFKLHDIWSVDSEENH